jgi:hypothetical protein
VESNRRQVRLSAQGTPNPAEPLPVERPAVLMQHEAVCTSPVFSQMQRELTSCRYRELMIDGQSSTKEVQPGRW